MLLNGPQFCVEQILTTHPGLPTRMKFTWGRLDDATCFEFGPEYRPVPLEYYALGYREAKSTFMFDNNLVPPGFSTKNRPTRASFFAVVQAVRFDSHVQSQPVHAGVLHIAQGLFSGSTGGGHRVVSLRRPLMHHQRTSPFCRSLRRRPPEETLKSL